MKPQPGSRLHVPRHLWQELGRGAGQMLPLSIGGLVFGLAMGAITVSAGIGPWVGSIGTAAVNSGAAQLAMIDLIGRGAPFVVVVGTALVVNARCALYSASLAKIYAAFPMRWRAALSFLLTDQAAAFQKHFTPLVPDPVRRRWFFLGGAGLFAGLATLGTIIGIILGPVIPESWDIGFIVPLMFLAIVLRTITDRPGVMAALIAAAVVIATRGLPYGTNVLVGTLAGIAITRLLAPAAWYRGGRVGDEDEPREGAP